jgi:xanthine dehydrogenase YagS FAD-binding subunit
VLRGATPDAATFRKAADAALANANPQSQNGFKIELARRCIVHALGQATAAT